MLRRLVALARQSGPVSPSSSASCSSLFSRRVLASFLMVLLTIGGALAPATVRAQSAVQPTVVLDFSVNDKDDPILGRKTADALAVELQRSGDFEVIPRQQVEEAVRTQPGLRPPYNEPTQARLAGVVGARSVFSGRVVRVLLSARRSARIQIEVRQLDAATGDFINGTQISEVTTDKLEDVDNDVLIDEAINKAAFAAVRAMKQTRLPEGTVMNVTRSDVETNLGTRSGAAPGQRYSVLRDVFNRALGRVERVKVGEVTIVRVEADASTAVLSAGGQAGVKTGDKVRQIFIPSAVAFVGGTGGTGSSSPVTAPPPVTGRGAGSGIKKIGSGLIGGLALLALIGLAGFGGGSNNSPAEAPRNVVAVPITSAATTSSPGTAINVNFREGLPGIIRGTDVAGYLIFRSTSANFATTPETLIDFVRGGQTNYTDTATPGLRRDITIEEDNPTTGNNTSQNNGRLVITDTTSTTAAQNEINQDADSIDITVTRPPLQLGVQYFYRVVRIMAQRTTTTNTGTGGNNQNQTVVNLNPVLSQTSASSGGATAIPTLRAVDFTTSNNLDDFTVTINALDPLGTGVGVVGLAVGEIDQIVVQVSRNSTFAEADTFNQIVANPGSNVDQTTTLRLGNIRVRNFEPGDPVFVRLGLRNSTDRPGGTIYSRPLQITPTGVDSVASRFVTGQGTGRRSGGVGLPGAPNSGLKSNGIRRTPGHILRPR
ncbi:MAG: hypothetical protein JWN98_347 [Abditibacteriota bacterium]|nr:hypothetical protein [Abditibacteriota bacterium]